MNQPELNKFLEFYPFNQGEIGIKLVNVNGTICSSHQISKGKFYCQSCSKKFTVGDSVLPIYWESRTPTNFICIYCRGLLKNNLDNS